MAALLAGCAGWAPDPARAPAAGLALYGLADGGFRAGHVLGSDPLAVALAADGRTAYVSDNAPGVVRAVAIPELKVRWTAAVGGRPGPLLVTLDTVLVSLFGSGEVVELSLGDGSVVARHPVGRGPGQLALSGNRVLVACADGRVYDVMGGSAPAVAGFALGAGAGGTWAADQAGGSLLRLEDSVRVQLPAHLHPFWAATGPGGDLWLTAEGDEEDADAGAVAVVGTSLQPRIVATPRDPDALATAGDRVFVAAHGERSVLVFDGAGHQPASWAQGAQPVALAADVQQALLVVVTNARE